MTVLEYIEVRMGQLSLDYNEDIVKATLERLGVSPSEDSKNVDQGDIDLFFYHTIPDVFMRAESISQGQYSVRWNKDALAAYYRMLARKLGMDDHLTDKPRITDISERW